MSAAPQESHDLPSCLVLLLGEKGASGRRKDEETLHNTLASPALSPLETSSREGQGTGK